MSELLLLPEAARRLRVPEATLRFWRSTAKGPKSFKIGRRVVYRSADVEAWIDAAAEVSA